MVPVHHLKSKVEYRFSQIRRENKAHQDNIQKLRWHVEKTCSDACRTINAKLKLPYLIILKHKKTNFRHNGTKIRPLYRAGQRDTCTVRSQPVFLCSFCFMSFLLQISPLITEVENISGYPRLFWGATFLPKYLTGCISHCFIVPRR